ncbi:Protein C-ets-1 [Plecturocebus cupreus]
MKAAVDLKPTLTIIKTEKVDLELFPSPGAGGKRALFDGDFFPENAYKYKDANITLNEHVTASSGSIFRVPERIWEHACNPFCLAGLNSGAAELQLLSFVFPASLPCNGQGLIGTMCEPGESPNPQNFSDMECADVPLLTPSSKEMMSQALKATFSGFTKEQQRLGIPKDPRQWTETHVRDWVMWAVNEFSLKGVDFQKFCMNGAALCALGKDCFLELAPDFVGDILWEHLEILQKEDVKPYQVNGVNPTYPESRYTSDYFISYGIEHAQCVPPSEFSEPSFITESYQTLHPISSEELLSLKYENDYPSVILRDPLQTDTLQNDYFAIKQEVVTPDNMCMGRTSRGRSYFFSKSSWVYKNYLAL